MIATAFTSRRLSKNRYLFRNRVASGNIIETGFEIAFLIIKRTDATANWRMLDNKRSTTNPRDKELFPNLANSESTFDAVNFL